MQSEPMSSDLTELSSTLFATMHATRDLSTSDEKNRTETSTVLAGDTTNDENENLTAGSDAIAEVFTSTYATAAQVHAMNHALTGILALIFVVGVLGNTCTIVTYMASKRLRIPTNIFIVGLAAADIFTLLCAPVIISNIETTDSSAVDSGGSSGSSGGQSIVQLHGSPAACYLVVVVLRMSTSLDMLTMAAIAVVRYLGVAKTRPPVLSVSGLSWSRCTACVVAIWLYTAVWSAVVFIPGVATVYYSERLYICVINTSNSIFTAVNITLVYFPSVLCLAASYAGIYAAVRRARLRVAQAMTSVVGTQKINQNRQRLVRETRLAVQLGLVFGVFVTCWTPYLITNIMGRVSLVPVWVSNLFVASIQTNAAVNPIIYLCYNRLYRRELCRIVFRFLPSSVGAAVAEPNVRFAVTRGFADQRQREVTGEVTGVANRRRDSLPSSDFSMTVGARAKHIACALPAVSSLVTMAPPPESCSFVKSGIGDLSSHLSRTLDDDPFSRRLHRQQQQMFDFDEVPSTTLFAAYSC